MCMRGSSAYTAQQQADEEADGRADSGEYHAPEEVVQQFPAALDEFALEGFALGLEGDHVDGLALSVGLGTLEVAVVLQLLDDDVEFFFRQLVLFGDGLQYESVGDDATIVVAFGGIVYAMHHGNFVFVEHEGTSLKEFAYPGGDECAQECREEGACDEQPYLSGGDAGFLLYIFGVFAVADGFDGDGKAYLVLVLVLDVEVLVFLEKGDDLGQVLDTQVQSARHSGEQLTFVDYLVVLAHFTYQKMQYGRCFFV